MSIDTLKLARQLLWRYRHETPIGNQPYMICQEVDEAFETIDQAIEQAQRPVIAWDTKEMWLQSWMPRLKDALQDVRNKQNSEAAETLYELYVEMNQQTLTEKIDTLSEMRTEDLLSSTVAELLATKKRLAYVEGILCRHHFEQAQKQEPVAWMRKDETCTDCFVWEKTEDHTIPLYTSPPQRQPLTDEQIKKLLKSMHGEPYPNDLYAFARAIEAAHGITGEQK